MSIERYDRHPYFVSTDPALLDPPAIRAFLATSYWAEAIPEETVRRSLEGSLCFGLYGPEGQIGLARVITDGATFAYLCDVYVLPNHRGQGLAKWMLTCVLESPQLQALRRWMLLTWDAHRVYEGLGFQRAERTDRIMMIEQRDLYRATGAG